MNTLTLLAEICLQLNRSCWVIPLWECTVPALGIQHAAFLLEKNNLAFCRAGAGNPWGLGAFSCSCPYQVELGEGFYPTPPARVLTKPPVPLLRARGASCPRKMSFQQEMSFFPKKHPLETPILQQTQGDNQAKPPFGSFIQTPRTF